MKPYVQSINTKTTKVQTYVLNDAGLLALLQSVGIGILPGDSVKFHITVPGGGDYSNERLSLAETANGGVVAVVTSTTERGE